MFEYSLPPRSAAALSAAPLFFRSKTSASGQHGIGRTVFPARASKSFKWRSWACSKTSAHGNPSSWRALRGGPLAETGVMQGMSGSPVYIDGTLAGAVALGFPGGEGSDRRDPADRRNAARRSRSGRAASTLAAHSEARSYMAAPAEAGGNRDAGFVYRLHAPRRWNTSLRNCANWDWIRAREFPAAGGPDRMGDLQDLEPGSMISVQLLSGDMRSSADGTVTAIDGNHVYAFGHRFLDSGPTDLPFARAEVLALLPDISSSFKISQAQEWMGTITQDRNTAVSGVAESAPPWCRSKSASGAKTYHMGVIQDRVMTPLVTQMAVFSAMDASDAPWARSLTGCAANWISKAGRCKIDSVYSGDVAVGALASLGVAAPLTYALSQRLRWLQAEERELIALSRWRTEPGADCGNRRAAPGATRRRRRTERDLAAANGVETSRKARYRVPVGAPMGTSISRFPIPLSPICWSSKPR